MATLPPQQNIPKVELRFKCTNLKNLDVLSKSDPQIFISQKRGNLGDFQFVGKTEKINNNLNPIFKTKIIIDYYFEQVQHLNFVVMDIDKEIKIFGDLDNDDKIGEYTTTLGNIISKPGKRCVGDIKHKGKVCGQIEIIAEEIQATGHNVILKLEGQKLDKKDLFSSDPYFKIYKVSPNGNLLVYTSVVIKSNLNPIYDPILMKLEELNGGDMFRELVIEFWDHDSVGSHDFIGMFRTTTDQLLRREITEFPLINPKKTAKSSSYKNSGIIRVTDARLVGQPTFIDYISNGCEINLIVAIDCTASNGSPLSTDSLHYHTPREPSQYAKSIMSVGSVLAPYDSDGNIEVLGFGGIHKGSTSHCFQFGSSLEARGVEGVLVMYEDVIKNMQLSYPTNFENIISYAAKKSLKGVDAKHQKYTILLILTDGEISDMKETVHEIVKASKAPLSIVIVGVGSSSFSNMTKLDGDDGALTDDKGNVAERDIVQFVEFSKHSNNPEALAAETLCEIPSQLLGYMSSQNYLPNLRH